VGAPPSTSSAAAARVDDFAADTRPVMLYDGVCGLCNAGVDAALKLDRKKALRFAALQSPAGRRLLQRSGRAPDDISSVVLVTADGRAFIESEAVVEIGRVLGVPGPVAAAALALPARGRDAAYRAVADNRYSIFGKTDACRLTQGGAGSEADDPGRFLVE
jgi:predicted DCC family thiol-disulfide oxidoreductase YuxK